MLFGKYVNKFYKKFFYDFFLGILFLILVDIIQLYIPELVGNLTASFDNGTLNDELINKTGIYILLIAVGMFLGRFLWRQFILKCSYKIGASLREEMFAKTLLLSKRFYRENKVGSIMSYYTSDIETIVDNYGWGLVMLVDATFLGVFTFIKMARVNLLLTGISAIPLLALVILSYFIDKKMEEIYVRRQDAFEHMSDYAQEIFTGLRVIKAFVREIKEATNFKKVNYDTKKKDLELVKFSAFLDMMISILIETMICISIFVGGILVYQNVIMNSSLGMDRAQMVEFLMYLNTIIWPMIALGSIVSLMSRAKASLKRISAYLDEEIEIKDENVTKEAILTKGEIVFKNFSYHYEDTNENIIKDVNLKIDSGTMVGVVGKVGSGKSTLVNLLLRISNIDENKVFIDGYDLMKLPIKQVRDSISYVPQDNFLFSTTIKDNIAFFDKNVDDEKIIEAAKFADVHKNIVDFADGYDTLVGERGVTLSGGQKQRISLARAYIKNAPIMILDDSVSAVDIKTEEQILRNLREKRKGKTTILVSSRVSTVQNLDKVIVMDEGNVVGYDSPKNLIDNCPLYAQMVRLQELEKEVQGD